MAAAANIEIHICGHNLVATAENFKVSIRCTSENRLNGHYSIFD